MLTIELTNLRFHAYHGLYEEEKKLGGDYEVNLVIVHHPVKIPILHLSETLDYTAVYELVKIAMQTPTPLLETLATLITQQIFTKFSQVQQVKVSVKKLHPPIIAFQGEVGVSYSLTR